MLARQAGEDEGLVGALEPDRAEAETARRHRLEDNDPATAGSVAGRLDQRLRECRAGNGEERFAAAMATVDPEVLEQLRRLAQEAT